MEQASDKNQTARGSGGFTPAEKNILFVTCSCHFLCHLFILVFPAVTMPLVKTLGIPLEDVVKISFLMYLLYGLCSFPAGLAVDRWQAKGTLIIGLFLMGGGLVLAGLFPSPHSMYFSLGVVGVGASVYHPAGLALISRTVTRRGFALGINGAFGNLGLASAPLITGVLTWLFSWQTTFYILGALAVLAGFLLALVPVDESLTRKENRASNNGVNLVKYFPILCLSLVFMGIAYRGNMILLPAYLELKTTFFQRAVDFLSPINPAGTSTLAATLLTSLILFTGIFGQIFGGKLADRIDLRRGYLLVHALSLPFLLGMAFTTNYTLAICAALYAFFSLGMQPIENSLIAALTPSRWRSTSYAVKFVLNFGVGATVVFFISAIKKSYSLETVYVFLGCVTALLVLSVLVLLYASRHVRSLRN